MSRARSRSCCTARRTTSLREASVLGARASRSLISPARRRASVMSASRRANSAFSVARIRRRSAVTASACAVRTCATRESAFHTSRSPMAWALTRAAATRAGRCTKASKGYCRVNSSCLGPSGKSNEKMGFRNSPASARSARAMPRSTSVAWKVGLFQSAMATASSCVRPSARLTSGGSGAPPSRRIPAVSVRARMAASRSPGVGAPFMDAHPALTTATLATSTRTIIRTFTMRDERRRRQRKQGAGQSRKMPPEIERCGKPSIPRISGMISAPT